MPYNKKHGYAKGKLMTPNSVCQVVVGQNIFIGTDCFIHVDEICLLRLRVGSEGDIFNLDFTYSRSDDLLVRIEQNEWITGDPTPWDLESDYQYLKLRSKPHDILLEL